MPNQQILQYGLLIVVYLAHTAALADEKPRHIEADLLIVGGTESGCTAAVQAARMGVPSIVLVNDIDWLGGQFSAEALVAIDENRGPDGYGHGVPFPRSGIFKEVMDRIEALNLRKYGRARPGNTRVITTCRPSDAEQVFRELVKPYVESGQLQIVSDFYPVSAALEDGNRLAEVRFRSSTNDTELTVSARVTIDASDWGDAIKAAGADYEFGPDLKNKYNEPLAPTSREQYPTSDMNPITYCMVVNETDRYEAIETPEGYDERNYRDHPYPKDPLWLYESRRVIDHYNFKDVTHPDVLLLCFPAFDYPLDEPTQRVVDALEANERGASKKNIAAMSRAQRQIIFDDAKRYSMGFLYYLQTTVHDAMPDKTHSFRRFELSSEFDTPDRMPPKPYVRESLRLKAMYMMKQQDTTGHGGRATDYATTMYHDGVACWQFEYDFHPTGRRFLVEGDPNGPWMGYLKPLRKWGPPYSGRSLFPLRSLVPEKIDGLLGGQKNLGYSSIVSSAVRLHDQSMAIGQASGAVAAVCVLRDVQPRVIPYDSELLSQVWSGLCSRIDDAQPQTLWPFRDLQPQDPAFEAINLLAVRKAFPLTSTMTDFRADEPATQEWRKAVVEQSLARKRFEVNPETPSEEMTRGEFARAWWNKINNLPEKPFDRKKKGDADDDGTPDQEDALPLDASNGSWPKFLIPADQDGNPDDFEDRKRVLRQFNFTGKDSAVIDGFENDYGIEFNYQRGFGWSRDVSQNNRRRNRIEGAWRDTFLFTRTHDQWECKVENGKYEVTICVGDAGHEQKGQNVAVEYHPVLRDHTTASGWFAEKSVEVEIKDGRLTIEIGEKGGTTNTCLNWLRFSRAD